MYHVDYTQKAYKDLKKLDKQTRKLLLSWIENNLVTCQNPRLHGKPLIADKSGQWRYRVGDYRILCEIQDEKLLILCLHLGHRREVYK